MLRGLTILLTGALICAPVALSAQVPPQPTTPQTPAPQTPAPLTGNALPPGISPVPYRILDQDRLLRGSRLGQAILAGIRAAEAALEAENQQYFDQLAAEERELTEARATLTPEAFRARADAFDARVEQIRAERAAASQELTRWSEAEAQRFFDAALPVLVQMMNEEGILALLKPDTLILGSDWLDITAEAIARLDASLASPDLPAPPQDQAPEPAPEDGTGGN